jgi:D-alanyl-D-alanine carboxypeptidase/D-alanyl-D-alanine-endopeptidase (penicillin-binding protein 4)
MKLHTFLILFIIGTIWSCTPTKLITEPILLPNPYHSTATYQIDTSPVFSNSFTGFVLYNPEEDRILDSLLYNKYFTPASNTKLFTCYAALKIFKDSIPALRYVISGDSLMFWGTGDPSLLNIDLDTNATVIQFLSKRTEKLFYAPQNVGARFGNGWSWDDYNYSFMSERNDLPLYGNMTRWRFKKGKKIPTSAPSYFDPMAVEATSSKNTSSLSRAEHDNIFKYNNPKKNRSHGRVIPMTTSSKLTRALLENALNRPIGDYTFSKSLNNHPNVKTIYSLPIDRVVREMMQSSDNFVAEQLLLSASYKLFDRFDAQKTMTYVKQQWLFDAPDEPIWEDGAGVSRYNLFTPRTMVYLLDKLRDEFGEERLFQIMAAGGKVGTLKRWYKNDTNEPYIYAKTGTLSNKLCLSGYLLTKSGKTLIFSFMHNNYVSGSKPLKIEMTRVLEFVRDNY